MGDTGLLTAVNLTRHRFRLYAALERHLVGRFVYRGIRPPAPADDSTDSRAASHSGDVIGCLLCADSSVRYGAAAFDAYQERIYI